jgi:hypothetical protein
LFWASVICVAGGIVAAPLEPPDELDELDDELLLLDEDELEPPLLEEDELDAELPPELDDELELLDDIGCPLTW